MEMELRTHAHPHEISEKSVWESWLNVPRSWKGKQRNQRHEAQEILMASVSGPKIAGKRCNVATGSELWAGRL